MLFKSLTKQMKTLLERSKQNQSTEVDQSKTAEEDNTDGELSRLWFQAFITDSVYSAMTQLSGKNRLEVVDMCRGFDFRKLSDTFYDDVCRHLKPKHLDAIASFIYSDLYKTYEASLALAIEERTSELGETIRFLLEEKDDIVEIVEDDLDEYGDNVVSIKKVNKTLN